MSRSTPLALATACWLATAWSPAAATVIHVPADEPTIQAGLDAAAPGDTVEVACGTYYEHGIQMRSGVTLVSETRDPACATIDAQNAGDGLVFYILTEPATIEGFTIQQGRSSYGGGVVVHYADAILRRCVIRESEGVYAGGGLSLYHSTTTMSFCDIVQNPDFAAHGVEAQLVLENCTLANNGHFVYIEYPWPGSRADRCIFYDTNGIGLGLTVNCSCVWPDPAPGTNFRADPLFCDAPGGDYGLMPGSPCLPGENPCGVLVGSHTLGCGTVDTVQVTVSTAPAGLPVEVDGFAYTSPAVFDWPQYSEHVVSVPALSPIDPERRYRYESWSDGGERTHTIWAPTNPATFTATEVLQVRLDREVQGNGSIVPTEEWYDEGTAVQIEAIPDARSYFREWIGRGNGSYTGTENPATVVLQEPIRQSAVFGPIGYDFTISASATDPFQVNAPPAGGPRDLFLWLTCSNAGLSAVEADVTGSLVPTEFHPLNGVLNAGSATFLLLAVPLCPTGEDIAFTLGYWTVDDPGGTLCLTQSAAHGILAAVDCIDGPNVIEDPRVVGFSSSNEIPCVIGVDRCGDPMTPASYTTVSVPGAYAPAPTAVRPNPFREEATLTFSLARPGPVRLIVYDVGGRTVRTLVEQGLPAGDHVVVWDGTDGARRPVPSGVYFVRLEAGRSRETMKLTRLRPR